MRVELLVCCIADLDTIIGKGFFCNLLRQTKNVFGWNKYNNIIFIINRTVNVNLVNQVDVPELKKLDYSSCKKSNRAIDKSNLI